MATGDNKLNLFRAMEIFVAVAETRQVTKAAAVLGITQSAASQHLKSLELEIGAPLFDRSSRPISLTRTGVEFHNRAEHILSDIDALRTDIRQARSFQPTILRTGILASLATTLTQPLLSMVSSMLPDAKPVIRAGLASDHLALLEARQIDLAVTSDPYYDVDRLERRTLLTEPFCLILPPDYNSPVEKLDDLAGVLPLVRFIPGSPVGRRTDQHLQRLKLAFPRSVEVDRSSLAVAAVASGHGFAILSPSLLIDGITEGLGMQIRPLPGPALTRTLTVVSRERELGDLPGLITVGLNTALQRAFAERLEPVAGFAARAIRYADQDE